MSQLRTIIFDMGNVIIPFDFRRGYALLESYVDIPAADLPERIRKTALVPEYESGRMESRAFVSALTKELGAELSYDEFCRIWTCIFLPDTLVPVSLLESLRRKYRVMVLSNTNEIHFEMVRKAYPILQHVDHFILSHEVKAMKPEPQIYAAALAEAKARPEECFFTDDIAAYVDAARQSGMQAEQFVGYEKLLADLRVRGVEI